MKYLIKLKWIIYFEHKYKHTRLKFVQHKRNKGNSPERIQTWIQIYEYFLEYISVRLFHRVYMLPVVPETRFKYLERPRLGNRGIHHNQRFQQDFLFWIRKATNLPLHPCIGQEYYSWKTGISMDYEQYPVRNGFDILVFAFQSESFPSGYFYTGPGCWLK